MPSTDVLTDFDHLVADNALIGFQFLSPEDASESFLTSRFIRDCRNVSLGRMLEIFLAPNAEAESDQGSFLGVGLFDDGTQDYIMVIPRVENAWLPLGFEPETQFIPVPDTRS